MKTALKILEEALTLLKKPDGWTKGKFAGDRSSRTTTILSPRATCFCSIGAVGRAAWLEGGFLETPPNHRTSLQAEAYSAYTLLQKASLELTGSRSILSLNDDANSFAEIEPVWERAIQLAKEQA